MILRDIARGEHLARSANLYIQDEFHKGVQQNYKGHIIDAATRSLMTGKGMTMAFVSGLVLDFMIRPMTEANFVAYSSDVLRLDSKTVERARALLYSSKTPAMSSAIIRRELELKDKGAATNLDKYLRALEYAGFIVRVRTKNGTEIAFYATPKGLSFEEELRNRITPKEAAE